MENMKKVWDTRDLVNLDPIFYPQEKKVFHPHTEIAPPLENNIQITGFDFNINVWTYIEAASPGDVMTQEEALVEIAEMAAENSLSIAGLVERVAALEGVKE